jgi:hypothetical protein
MACCMSDVDGTMAVPDSVPQDRERPVAPEAASTVLRRRGIGDNG